VGRKTGPRLWLPWTSSLSGRGEGLLLEEGGESRDQKRGPRNLGIRGPSIYHLNEGARKKRSLIETVPRVGGAIFLKERTPLSYLQKGAKKHSQEEKRRNPEGQALFRGSQGKEKKEKGRSHLL